MPVGMTIKITYPILQPEKFSKPLSKVIEKYLERARRLMLSPTSTWKAEHKPEFVKRHDYLLTDTLSGLMITGSTPYVFVSKGTRGGRATFSDDWSPKTRPGSLRASRGSGTYKSGRGPRINTAARDFDVLTADRLKKGFERDAQKALESAANKILPGATRGGKTGVTVIRL